MTDGDCYRCGESYTKRGMSRHLRACLPDSDGEATLHLRIAGARRSDYWLHLALEGETTLATLDSFLRRLWLECCSHMSAFTVGNVRYEKPYTDDEPAIGLRTERRPMDVPIGSVVGATDEEFGYEYDFGSTTALEIRVVDVGGWDLESLAERGTDAVTAGPDEIALLARNHEPEIACGSCDEPAETVCQTCLWERGPDAWLCEACADAHEDDCTRPSYLPRVNSPRTGVCAYAGSSMDV